MSQQNTEQMVQERNSVVDNNRTVVVETFSAVIDTYIDEKLSSLEEPRISAFNEAQLCLLELKSQEVLEAPNPALFIHHSAKLLSALKFDKDLKDNFKSTLSSLVPEDYFRIQLLVHLLKYEQDKNKILPTDIVAVLKDLASDFEVLPSNEKAAPLLRKKIYSALGIKEEGNEKPDDSEYKLLTKIYKTHISHFGASPVQRKEVPTFPAPSSPHAGKSAFEFASGIFSKAKSKVSTVAGKVTETVSAVVDERKEKARLEKEEKEKRLQEALKPREGSPVTVLWNAAGALAGDNKEKTVQMEPLRDSMDGSESSPVPPKVSIQPPKQLRKKKTVIARPAKVVGEVGGAELQTFVPNPTAVPATVLPAVGVVQNSDDTAQQKMQEDAQIKAAEEAKRKAVEEAAAKQAAEDAAKRKAEEAAATLKAAEQKAAAAEAERLREIAKEQKRAAERKLLEDNYARKLQVAEKAEADRKKGVQDNYENIKKEIAQLEKAIPAYRENINLTISGIEQRMDLALQEKIMPFAKLRVPNNISNPDKLTYATAGTEKEKEAIVDKYAKRFWNIGFMGFMVDRKGYEARVEAVKEYFEADMVSEWIRGDMSKAVLGGVGRNYTTTEEMQEVWDKHFKGRPAYFDGLLKKQNMLAGAIDERDRKNTELQNLMHANPWLDNAAIAAVPQASQANVSTATVATFGRGAGQ